MKELSNTLLDNTSEARSVSHAVRALLSSGSYTRMRVLTGYVDMGGLSALGEPLQEWLSHEEHRLQLLLHNDPRAKRGELSGAAYPQDYMLRDLRSAKPSGLSAGVASALAHGLEDRRVEVRVLSADEKQSARPAGMNMALFDDPKTGYAVAILGTANVTEAGLTGPGQLCYMEVQSALCLAPETAATLSPAALFDRLFAEATPWMQTLALSLKQYGFSVVSARLAQQTKPTPAQTTAQAKKEEVLPIDLYHKILVRKLLPVVDNSRLCTLVEGLPGHLSLRPWQAEVVEEALVACREAGSFVLSHVAGAPKSLLAALIARSFIAEPGQRPPYVLLITTAAIGQQWADILQLLDRDNTLGLREHIEIVCLSSIARPQPGDLLSDFDLDDPARDEADTGRVMASFKRDNYGMLLLDEAHKYTHPEAPLYVKLRQLAHSPVAPDARLNPLVGFLGIVPHLLDASDLGHILALSPTPPLTVQRSLADLRSMDVTMPAFRGVETIDCPLDEENAALWVDTAGMLDNPNTIQLWCAQQPLAQRGATEQQQQRARLLANIVRLDLVRRLMSSAAAFKAQLHKVVGATQRYIEQWEADDIFLCPDLDVLGELDTEKSFHKIGRTYTLSECLGHLRERLRSLNERYPNSENRELRQADFDARLIDGLRADYKQLRKIEQSWQAVTDDSKMSSLVESIRLEHSQHAFSTAIFTNFPETAAALRSAVEARCPGARCLVVTPKTRKMHDQTLRENFSEGYAGAHKEEYDVLISTDALGDTLDVGRCSVVVSYDAPWSLLRLHERLARALTPLSGQPSVRLWRVAPKIENPDLARLIARVGVATADADMLGRAGEVMAGQVAPLTPHLCELRRLAQDDGEALRRLAHLTGPTELGAEAGRDTAYFLIRKPPFNDVYVAVDQSIRPRLLPLAEFLDAVRTHSTQPGPLPDDYSEQRGAALLAASEHYKTLAAAQQGAKATPGEPEVLCAMTF